MPNRDLFAKLTLQDSFLKRTNFIHESLGLILGTPVFKKFKNS